jgi:hypothetical protein
MELYLHAPYISMVCCIIKHRDNFTITFNRRVISILYNAPTTCDYLTVHAALYYTYLKIRTQEINLTNVNNTRVKHVSNHVHLSILQMCRNKKFMPLHAHLSSKSAAQYILHTIYKIKKHKMKSLKMYLNPLNVLCSDVNKPLNLNVLFSLPFTMLRTAEKCFPTLYVLGTTKYKHSKQQKIKESTHKSNNPNNTQTKHLEIFTYTVHYTECLSLVFHKCPGSFWTPN